MILYGIANCDTVRKARAWLGGRGVVYRFHDYRKDGVEPERLAAWSEAVGWEALLNRRGTTFRKLDEGARSDLDADKALALMATHPSLIRRPVVEREGPLLVGFDPAEWERALG